DQGMIFDHAPFDQCSMADGDATADDRRQLDPAVQDRVVLNRGLLADLDTGEVAPQDGSEPDVGAVGDADVADEHCGGGQPDVATDSRCYPVELHKRGHLSSPRSA